MDIVGTDASDTLYGTASDDSIVGLQGDDLLYGSQLANASNDVLQGGPGNDTLYAFWGNDTLQGGAGDDWLQADTGNDLLHGGDGNDVFANHPGSDTAIGGLGNDSFSDVRDDLAQGGLGDDAFALFNGVAYGEEGNDVFTIDFTGFQTGGGVVYGGAGQDSFVLVKEEIYAFGGPTTVADFTLEVGEADLIDVEDLLVWIGFAGGNPFATGFLQLMQSGADTLLEFDRDGSAGSAYGLVTLLVLQGVEIASITPANFVDGIAPDGSPVAGMTVTGTAGNDSLTDGIFDDTLLGMEGADRLQGGIGNDLIRGGPGNDTLAGGGFGSDTLIGGAGSDILRSGIPDDNVFEDWLFGGAGDDFFGFSAGPTFLFGEDGADTFSFDALTNSTVTGGPGEDVYLPPPSGFDVVTDFATGSEEQDVIKLSGLLQYNLLDDEGPDTYTGNPFFGGVFRLIESGGDTLLQRNSDFLSPQQYVGVGFETTYVTVLTLQGVDSISLTSENFFGNPDLGGGDDVLVATSGKDVRFGLAGNDSIIGLAGNDTLMGNAGNDTLRASQGEDSVHGGPGNDLLFAGIGNDTLRGGQGGDEIHGLEGNDTILGDLGGDTLRGGMGNDEVRGGPENDFVYGGLGNDLVFGGLGTDTLTGAEGEDTLTGGLDADLFRLTAPDGDLILDFESGIDKVELAASAFSAGGFVVGTSAADADDRLIYDAASGNLYYDADGSGAGEKVLVGVFGSTTHPTLAASDFLVA